MFFRFKWFLATPDGIEPPYTESKSVVLPLNERAILKPAPYKLILYI